ncbi:MAG TPA: hypothetical protein VH306_02620 [Gaiellaceae bacterium]
MNKRKAMIGWAVYTVGKPVVMRAARRKVKTNAKNAVPATTEKSRFRPNKAAIVAGVGAAAGAVFFWRRSKSGGSPTESPAGS